MTPKWKIGQRVNKLQARMKKLMYTSTLRNYCWMSHRRQQQNESGNKQPLPLIHYLDLIVCSHPQ